VFDATNGERLETVIGSDERFGEWYVSGNLSRAVSITRAAHSIIATLWSIPDGAAIARIVNAFYFGFETCCRRSRVSRGRSAKMMQN